MKIKKYFLKPNGHLHNTKVLAEYFHYEARVLRLIIQCPRVVYQTNP